MKTVYWTLEGESFHESNYIFSKLIFEQFLKLFKSDCFFWTIDLVTPEALDGLFRALQCNDQTQTFYS